MATTFRDLLDMEKQKNTTEDDLEITVKGVAYRVGYADDLVLVGGAETEEADQVEIVPVPYDETATRLKVVITHGDEGEQQDVAEDDIANVGVRLIEL